MGRYQKDVKRVINEYIRPDSTLATMQSIHSELTGESQNFTRWDDVETSYIQMDWNDESYRRFLELSREFVEGDTETISESYFDINEPEDNLLETILDALSSNEIDETDDITTEEGFVYRLRDDEVIESTYYFSSVSIEITAEPNIRREPVPKSINFRINPSERLLIVEKTYPAHVRKLQSVFNNETIVDLSICGDLTVLPGQADQSVISLINDFRDEENKISHE